MKTKSKGPLDAEPRVSQDVILVSQPGYFVELQPSPRVLHHLPLSTSAVTLSPSNLQSLSYFDSSKKNFRTRYLNILNC